MRLKRSKRAEQTGEILLAEAFLKLGIGFLATVPSVPGRDFIECVRSEGKGVNIAWCSRGKTAVEQALGYCLKTPGAAVHLSGAAFADALDSLATLPFCDWAGGLLIFVADDPGCWFQYNATDSRKLAAGLGIPVVEPLHLQHAFELLPICWEWSCRYRMPIVVRYTSVFTFESAPAKKRKKKTIVQMEAGETRKTHVVPRSDWADRQILWQMRLDELASAPELETLCEHQGTGGKLVVTAGNVAQKIKEVVDFKASGLRFLACPVTFPWPSERLRPFFGSVSEIVVIEEGAPLVEGQIRAFCHQGLKHVVIRGKDDHTVPLVGEIFRWQIEDFLSSWHPPLKTRGMFFPYQERREPDLVALFCSSCEYEGLLKSLHASLTKILGDVAFVADPGCIQHHLHRLSLPVAAEFSPGSSISLALALREKDPQCYYIPIFGDGAFFHSGFQALLDAVAQGKSVLVVLVDNQTAAMGGLAPVPGSEKQVPGKAIQIRELLQALPVKSVSVSANEVVRSLPSILQDFVQNNEVFVLHVQLPCIFAEELEAEKLDKEIIHETGSDRS